MKIQRLKKLDPNSFEQITTLWLETGITNPARKDDIDSVQHSLDHTGEILMATLDGMAVGTVWLNHDYRRLYIHHMAVKPAYQNQGIGRALLRLALDICRDLGYQAKLEVHRDNPAARHLYASLGFTDLDGYITMIKREI